VSTQELPIDASGPNGARHDGRAAWRTVPGAAPGTGRPNPYRRVTWRRAAVGVGIAAAVVGLAALGAVWLLGGGGKRQAPPIDVRCEATANEGTSRLETEQTANAALIAQVAVRRGLPPRAVTIALATAMQESSLINVDYGDRDSLGLFQQRPSQGWGTPEEVMDPTYAAGAFYDALVLVPGYLDMPITEAAQAVQRSAYPDAYAKHETTARRFASALTGQSPAGLTCILDKPDGPGTADEFAKRARRELGKKRVGAVAEAEENQPASVVLVGSDGAHMWSLAAWAVALAQDGRVTAVETGSGARWSREDGLWRDRTPAEAAIRALGPTEVLVSLGPLPQGDAQD
jgi:hypothetical protein